MGRREWSELPALLSVADLAARYGCSERDVRRRCSEGRLPRPVDPSAKFKQWRPDVIAEFELTGIPAEAGRGSDQLRSVS